MSVTGTSSCFNGAHNERAESENRRLTYTTETKSKIGRYKNTKII